MTFTLRGTLDTTQFYPSGSSDADTLHIAIERLPRRRPARLVIDSEGRVTVRLRGVDAPELHERPRCPMGLSRKEREAFMAHAATFRQPYAMRSVSRFRTWLAPGENTLVRCELRGESFATACDAYGRLIADLFVRGDNANLWLVRRGHAFPALYRSIPEAVRGQIRRAARDAAEARRGVWARFTREVDAFDPALRFPVRVGEEDRGAILWPKLFRRLCAWYVAKRAGLLAGALRDPLVAEGRLIAMPEAMVLRG